MVEFLGHKFYPLPPGVDLRDEKAMAIYAESVPVQAMMLVLLGWALGTFAGAWVAARIAIMAKVAYLVGGIFLAAAVANMLLVPHPKWMLISALVVIPICAYFGGRLALKGRGHS
jgi:hypothetical protein